MRLRRRRSWGGARPGAGRPRKTEEPVVEESAAEELVETREEWMLRTVIEQNIRSVRDPFFMLLTDEQAAEIIERARPYQEPLVCWKCEDATALPTGYRCSSCCEVT